MPFKREIISEREKAVIIYAVRTGKDKTNDDFRRMYALSRESQTYKQAMNNAAGPTVARWKCGTGVQKFLEEQRKEFQEENERAANERAKELVKMKMNADSGKTPEMADFLIEGVNFQDRTEFLNFLNIQANKITDPKQKLDYLKLISDLMRLKESDNKANEEIQRFYTPVTCSECSIYLKIKEKQDSKTFGK